ncbi:MAG: CsgG/HfaB family protein, partial [Armatimonadota bacterium]|nr:CsgG/HfaB family protein [Armatimonadota bacterium]
MKRFKQHWCARPLSWLLSVALIWPALLGLLAGGSSPARAQALTVSAQPLWAVLDFENRSGYGGAEVGRIASDAFVVELGKSNKYEVLSRQETQKGLADTGQTPPLDVVGVEKLGRALSADAVATGEVAAISFSSNPRQATASVIVRVTDRRTGELVNGALAQGKSNPRTVNTGDDDELVNQAINNAAFAAVRQVAGFNLPKATVLNNIDQDTVLLNKGTRDGMYDNLNMVVTRNGNEVGRIKVASASGDQSNAVVTVRGLGIQPQDKATAIYQLPGYTVQDGILHAKSADLSTDGAAGGKRHNAFSGVTGILLAIVAGALLLSLIRRGSGGSGSSVGGLGGAQVGKPVAVSNRTDVIGGQGASPGSTPNSSALFGFSITTPPVPADYLPISVRITATTGNISANNFVEFHVYRSDFPALLNDAGYAAGVASGKFVSQPQIGRAPLLSQASKSLQVFDDGADKLVVFSKPNPTGGNVALTTVNSGVTVPGTGIQHVGDRFQYFIEGVYIQPSALNSSGPNPGSPGNTGGGSVTTPLYQLTGMNPTNFVTYIDPVLIDGGSAATNPLGSFASSTGPDNVTLNVPSTRTADDYILELSQSIGFQNKAVLTPDSSAPYNADVTAPRRGNPVTWFLRTGGRLKTLSQLFPGAAQIFARIGARDSRNGSNTDTNPYVYSDPVAVPATLLPTG